MHTRSTECRVFVHFGVWLLSTGRRIYLLLYMNVGFRIFRLLCEKLSETFFAKRQGDVFC